MLQIELDETKLTAISSECDRSYLAGAQNALERLSTTPLPLSAQEVDLLKTLRGYVDSARKPLTEYCALPVPDKTTGLLYESKQFFGFEDDLQRERNVLLTKRREEARISCFASAAAYKGGLDVISQHNPRLYEFILESTSKQVCEGELQAISGLSALSGSIDAILRQNGV